MGLSKDPARRKKQLAALQAGREISAANRAQREAERRTREIEGKHRDAPPAGGSPAKQKERASGRRAESRRRTEPEPRKPGGVLTFLARALGQD